MSERDEEVSRIYREAAHPEPPSRLDADILAAARKALQAPQRRPRWWRMAAPVSALAVVIITVSLALRVHDEETRRARLPAVPAQTPASQAETAGRPLSPGSAAEPERKARAGTLAKQRLKPAAADQAASGNSTSGGAPAPEASPAPAPSASAGAIAQSPVPADAAPGEQRMESIQATQPFRALAAPDTPETLVERIRALKRAGRTDEALRALAQLKERYPAFRVPEDLRDMASR
jgi:hypothetical protein